MKIFFVFSGGLKKYKPRKWNRSKSPFRIAQKKVLAYMNLMSSTNRKLKLKNLFAMARIFLYFILFKIF
jgi:hypothetical protein